MATVLTTYYRPKPGGLCKRLFRAINALLDRGHTVHYLAVAAFPIQHARCHFHQFPWSAQKTDTPLFWVVFYLYAPVLLLYLGIRHRITHTFAFGSTYGYVLQPVRLVLQIPLTLFLRTDTLEHHRYRGRRALTMAIESLVEGIAIAGNAVFCNAQILAQRVQSRHSLLRARFVGTIPNDIPPPRAVESASRPYRVPLRLGCVGTLERNKNHALAIECVSRLRRDEASLSIFGLGTEEARLRDLARALAASDRVTFKGWVSSPGDIWSTIDLLLFPSHQEGSPNAVLEAIAHAVPVLASDIPEHRELLPQAALLDLRDPSAWVATVRGLISSPQSLERLIESEQQRIAPLVFDWDARMELAIVSPVSPTTRG